MIERNCMSYDHEVEVEMCSDQTEQHNDTSQSSMIQQEKWSLMEEQFHKES